MDMTPHFPIYLDYGATTPVDPRVVDAMIPWLREHFGNAASRSHAWGGEAEEAIENFRSAADDKGNPLHPHFADVEEDMTTLALGYVARKLAVPPHNLG